MDSGVLTWRQRRGDQKQAQACGGCAPALSAGKGSTHGHPIGEGTPSARSLVCTSHTNKRDLFPGDLVGSGAGAGKG